MGIALHFWFKIHRSPPQNRRGAVTLFKLQCGSAASAYRLSSGDEVIHCFLYCKDADAPCPRLFLRALNGCADNICGIKLQIRLGDREAVDDFSGGDCLDDIIHVLLTAWLLIIISRIDTAGGRSDRISCRILAGQDRDVL